MFKRLLVVLLPTLWLGCNDPQDPKTWISRLDDPRESKEAVRQLVKLKDKAAVAPLIARFKRTQDPEDLKAIASFGDPSAVPVLIESLEFTEDAYDKASTAASALGDLGDKSAVDPLLKVFATRTQIKSRSNVVKVEAIKALAKLKDPKAVDTLIKIVGTSAEEQDFYLNKLAAKALGTFADPKAASVLVRGLFMQGAGATAGSNIFQECRTALIAIGEPAVDKAVEAMQHKTAEIEADAKKYDFIPGIVVQKTSSLLGDLRSKKAVPALLAQLGGKDAGLAAKGGVSEHQSVIIALGQIGDGAASQPLLNLLTDPKKSFKHRAAAAEALNLIGDTAALSSLGKVASTTKWLAGTTIDPEAAQVVAVALTNYSRLADETSPPPAYPKLDAELTDSDMGMAVKASKARIDVAKECKKDVACYAKYLTDKDSNKGEKAAFMLSRLGKPSLPALTKELGNREPLVRMAVLFALSRVADKTCVEVRKALDDQIALDETKPPMRPIVHEMLALRMMISH